MRFRSSVSLLCLVFVPIAVTADAAQLTVLKTFNGLTAEHPQGPLVLENGVLYGTNTTLGPPGFGNDPVGNAFKMNSDGTGYQILKQFAHLSAPYGPSGSLALDGNTLYGTTQAVSPGIGFVYTVDTAGNNYQIVHSFDDSNAGWPTSGVILDGSTLYGTTTFGGSVFRVDTNGTGFQILASLPIGLGVGGGVTLVGSTLFGVTYAGGAGDHGTIYRVNTDGTGYLVIHEFAGGLLDGSQPWFVDLVSDGSSLFGTTRDGGANNKGVVFKIDLNGSNYEPLHSFSGVDGANPQAGLTLVGSTLYGVTGGLLSIFRINTDGTSFESLHQETAGSSAIGDGRAALTPGGANVFYGTTYDGGANGRGTVFIFVVPEPSGLALAAIGLLGAMTLRRRIG